METAAKDKYQGVIERRSSDTAPRLSPGISKDDILIMTERYAPCLRLHRREAHFPGDPDRFRAKSRFRESFHWLDKGWNREEERWETGDSLENRYRNIPWDHIVAESLERFPGDARIDPPHSGNLRPRDDRNMCERGSVRGLFLQPSFPSSARSSGNVPHPGSFVEAPVFADASYDAGTALLKILYWFFYELNWWKFVFTHQGDWEHVTLVFQGEDITKDSEPDYVYFAQHDGGVIVPFTALELEEKTHPVVYVCRDGHPCCHTVRFPSEYPIRWRTWENDIHFITDRVWRDYAGAWGEVGEFKFTTGPLGPLFKRHGDRVRIKIREGRRYVVVFKP